MRAVVVALVVGAGICAPSVAMATEGQWHLGGGLGVGSFARSESGTGPALGIHAAYELSDMFDAQLELTASQHGFVEGETTRFYGALVGLTYKIDIIEWVPYFGVYGGAFAFDGAVRPAPLAEREMGIAFSLGLDHAFSRSFAVGGQLRYHGFMSDPLSSLSDAPYFTALLRAEARFGW